MLIPLLQRLQGPGWPGHLLAVFAGSLTTLGLTPFDIWPLGLASAALLYWLLAPLPAKPAAVRGWAWGLGLFASGISWVYVSIHVHGYAPAWLAGLLTALFVASLALLPAAMAWLWTRWLRPQRSGWLSASGFAALVIAQEIFRGWFLTGFPWLYQGYVHTDTWLVGWAPLGGVWLTGFLGVLTGCLLIERHIWRGMRSAAGAVALISALWLGGLALSQIEWTRPAGDPLSVALIQADIPQARKWDPAHIDHSLALYRDLSYAQRPVDILVWPETAVPLLESTARSFVQGVAANLAERGTTLITGIPIDEYQPDGSMRIYNGIMVARPEPDIYLKHKLVPFGEYVPLENWLRGLIAFFDLPMSSFSRGPAEQAPLRAAGYRLAPLICYETVYPAFTAKLAAQSELLISISNDSWFGRSIGPLQHLQMARMRSIESGRWMMRGTNNGVTALIDHHGVIRASIPQFRQATLSGWVQPRDSLTPYLRAGNWPLGVLIAVTLMVCIGQRQRAR